MVCFVSYFPDLVWLLWQLFFFLKNSCNFTKHCKISHAIAWWQQYCNPVHLNGGQIIWSQKIIRPPDCCQKRINLFRMQKLELLISSLSNADELAFLKKICKSFILEFIQLFLKRAAALEIPKDFKVKKCRCHFHRWYLYAF